MKARSATLVAWKVLTSSQIKDRPGPLIVATICIALGIALATSIYWVNATAIDEFTGAARRLVGESDLIVRGSQGGFDEALYPLLARDPRVETASPVLEVSVVTHDQRRPLKIQGLDVLRAGQIQPGLLRSLGPMTRRLFAPDAIVLSARAAELLGKRSGEGLQIEAGDRVRTLRIVGVMPHTDFDAALGIMDIASAQWTLEAVSRLNRIDLRLVAGTDAHAFAQRLAGRLPAGVVVVTPAIETARAATVTRAYRVNLNVLALVALLTGAFLIFSVQSLSLLRRRASIALLRALGVRQAEILKALLAEGFAIGAAGSVLGSLLGYACATAIIRIVQGDFGNGQIQIGELGPHLTLMSLLATVLLGSLAAIAGAALPAWEASHRPPARALKAGDAEIAARLGSIVPGLLLLLAGGVCALLPAQADVPVFGYAAIGALLFGAVWLMPTVIARVVWAIPSSGRVVIDAALAQLKGSVGLMSVALAPIVVSVALMVAMATMVHSFRESFEQWLGKLLPADIQLRLPPGSETVSWPERRQTELRGVQGIARAQFRRTRLVFLGTDSLGADREPVVLIARDIDPGSAADVLPLTSSSAKPHTTAPAATRERAPLVWISEAIADAYGIHPGDTLRLPLTGRAVACTVAGVWRDYARSSGAVVISRADYVRISGDSGANEASLWLQPGADAHTAEQAIRTTLDASRLVDIMSSSELRARSLRIFDRAFAITYALEVLAIVIGLAGISVAASSTTISRRAEFGMLRHVGMTRGQITRMLAGEGLVTSALGVGYGLGLGILLSVVLVFVINRQSFHWSIDFTIPAAELALLAATLIAAAALTAVWSGRAATHRSALSAVREDW